MPTITDQDRSYRRGLVLGLTMAEIAILIIFILLLALGALLARKEKEIDALQETLDIYAWLGPILAQHDTPEEMNHAIEQLRRAEELANQIRELEQQLTEFREIQQIVGDASVDQESTKTIPELVRELILIREAIVRSGLPVTVAELEQALDDAAQARQILERLGADGQNDLVEEIEKLQGENQDLRGQLANLRRQAEAIGSGLEMPSCWATPDGRAEYIFDIALTNEGLIVRDRDLPHRVIQKADLPISDISFNVVLSPQDFRDQALALRNWSDENECRFYVRAFDETGSTEKQIYKEHMRAVEDRFYKYEVKDETFN